MISWHTAGIHNCPECLILIKEEHGFIETNPDFWDCECTGLGSIKRKELQPSCDRCDSVHEDCADSRAVELQHFGYIQNNRDV